MVISNKGTLNKLKPQFKSGCLLRIKRLNAKSCLNGLLSNYARFPADEKDENTFQILSYQIQSIKNH